MHVFIIQRVIYIFIHVYTHVKYFYPSLLSADAGIALLASVGSAQVHLGATLSHHGKDAVAADPGRSCRQEKKHNLAAPSSEYRRDGAPCRSEGFPWDIPSLGAMGRGPAPGKKSE